MATSENLGAKVQYGPRELEDKFAGGVKTEGVVKQIVLDFAYDDLPAESATVPQAQVPANALIVSSRLYVKTAFASGTPATDNINVGLYQADGTVIDADGLDAGITVATLAANAWVIGDGALVGATVGTAAGQVRVGVVAGTLTAGEARLVIEYIDPR